MTISMWAQKIAHEYSPRCNAGTSGYHTNHSCNCLMLAGRIERAMFSVENGTFRDERREARLASLCAIFKQAPDKMLDQLMTDAEAGLSNKEAAEHSAAVLNVLAKDIR